MQLFSMRRAEIVDEALVVHSNGIDHQGVAALVVADRLAVPGWLWIFRMRHIEIDMPNLLVAGEDDHHLLRRLDEIHRLKTIQVKRRDTRRAAARVRREGDLPREHLIVVLLHPLLNPGLQIWIAEVSDEECRLLAGTGSLGVADARVGWIIAHGTGPAGYGSEFDIECEPRGLVR